MNCRPFVELVPLLRGKF